jgi:hypothetical protein
VDCSAPGIVCKSGVIANETWTATNLYVVTGDITVPAGATLTINSGVIVKFLYSTYSSTRMSLAVAGNLQVNGTPGSKAYFTSSADDTVGGDTDGDPSTTGAAGQWGGISFQSGGTGPIQNAELRYGGYDGGYMGAVHLTGSSPTLDGLTVADFDWSAISALITDRPAITNFSCAHTPICGLEIRAGTLTTAATWSTTGIVYVPNGDLTVAQTGSLTIGPGVIVKPYYNPYSSNRVSFTVAGGLQINGVGSKVNFTSFFDDNIGGDTNSDDSTNASAAGQWGGISFQAGSTGSIQNAELCYGGYDGGGMGVVYLNGSSPPLHGVVVNKGYRSAISALATDNPEITGFSCNSTPICGLEIRSSTLTTNATWCTTGIVYVPAGDFTIPQGTTLTICPGVNVKFLVDYSDYSLIVAGQLLVNGAPGAKSYLTTIADDAIGGDTDSSASTPSVGAWGGLEFPAGGAGVLSYAEIRYANYGLYSSGGNVSFANGTLYKNNYGVSNNGLPELAVHRSNLVANPTYAAYAPPSSGGVDARWNWWGSTSCPSTSGANKVSSNVKYEPCIPEEIVDSRPTVTTLSSSANPSEVGDEVTFTATVTGTAGCPTGNVHFLDGSSELCAKALGSCTGTSSAATCSTSSLSLGTHSITAEYTGDSTFDHSTSSPALSQEVVPARPKVSIDDISVEEGQSGTTVAYLTVSLSMASTEKITVDWATQDGTAEAGNDYVAVPVTHLVFAPGVTVRQIPVQILGDTEPEADETFTVVLSGPTGATLVKARGDVQILNDDFLFYTVNPCRVFDSRDAAGPTAGLPLGCGGERDFMIAGGTCGVPLGAKAVSLNLTVTAPSAQGNVRLFASGEPSPLVSTLNYVAGQTRANNAIAPLSSSGQMAVLCAPSGTTHVIVDVNGYFQ